MSNRLIWIGCIVRQSFCGINTSLLVDFIYYKLVFDGLMPIMAALVVVTTADAMRLSFTLLADGVIECETVNRMDI